MKKDEKREREAARLAEETRLLLEEDGATVRGLLDAARLAARAGWELDEAMEAHAKGRHGLAILSLGSFRTRLMMAASELGWENDEVRALDLRAAEIEGRLSATIDRLAVRAA